MALAVSMAMVVVCGCKKEAAAQDVATQEAAAAAVPAEAQDAASTDDDSAAPAFKKSDGYKVGAAMAAMTVVCGVAKPAEAEAGLAKMKVEAAVNGVDPAEIEAIYRGALAQGKAAQAQDPDKVEQDCAGLRKMADPAEVKKMEQAAKELEAWAKKMEAEAKYAPAPGELRRRPAPAGRFRCGGYAGSRKNAAAVAVLPAAVAATSSPRSRASSSTMCGRNAGSLRRSFGIGLSVRGSR